jgi:nucleoid-associated protein YgaU
MSEQHGSAEAAGASQSWPGTQPLTEGADPDENAPPNHGEPSDESAGHEHSVATRKSFVLRALLLGNVKRETRAGVAIVFSFTILTIVFLNHRFHKPATPDSNSNVSAARRTAASEVPKDETHGKQPTPPPLNRIPSPPRSDALAKSPRPSVDTVQPAIGTGPAPAAPAPVPTTPVSLANANADLDGRPTASAPPPAASETPPDPLSDHVALAANELAPSPSPNQALPDPEPSPVGDAPPPAVALSGKQDEASPPPTEARNEPGPIPSVPPPSQPTTNRISPSGEESPTNPTSASPERPAAPVEEIAPAEPPPGSTRSDSSDSPPPHPLPSNFAIPAIPSTDGPDWVEIPNARRRPPADDPQAAQPRTTSTGQAPSRRTADAVDDPIEPVRHQVRSGENFWTISRQYYGSGRYYKALWAANSDRVPAPDKLVVGTTVRIPPPEALDRSLVVASSKEASAAVDPNLAGRQAQDSPHPRTGASGRVHGNSEIELTLPVGHPTATPGRSRRADKEALADNGAEAQYPKYLVRPRETLRSIARDTLGDSHRDEEILEMNRDAIPDPKHLTAGQILILPDDARLVRRTR